MYECVSPLVQEIDRKVESIDSAHRMTKQQQDTFKQRLNELAEALVNISNKVNG
jgi:chaperonin cofactor prefoldin